MCINECPHCQGFGRGFRWKQLNLIRLSWWSLCPPPVTLLPEALLLRASVHTLSRSRNEKLHGVVVQCPFKQLHVLLWGCFQAYMCAWRGETAQWNTVGKKSAAVSLHQRFSCSLTTCGGVLSSLVDFSFYDASTPSVYRNTHNWYTIFMYSKDPQCEQSWIHSIYWEAANFSCLGSQLTL